MNIQSHIYSPKTSRGFQPATKYQPLRADQVRFGEEKPKLPADIKPLVDLWNEFSTMSGPGTKTDTQAWFQSARTFMTGKLIPALQALSDGRFSDPADPAVQGAVEDIGQWILTIVAQYGTTEDIELAFRKGIKLHDETGDWSPLAYAVMAHHFDPVQGRNNVDLLLNRMRQETPDLSNSPGGKAAYGVAIKNDDETMALLLGACLGKSDFEIRTRLALRRSIRL